MAYGERLAPDLTVPVKLASDQHLLWLSRSLRKSFDNWHLRAHLGLLLKLGTALA